MIHSIIQTPSIIDQIFFVGKYCTTIVYFNNTPRLFWLLQTRLEFHHLTSNDDLKLFKYWFFIDCLASECNFDSEFSIGRVFSTALYRMRFTTHFSISLECILHYLLEAQVRANMLTLGTAGAKLFTSSLKRKLKIEKFMISWKEKQRQESRCEHLQAYVLVSYLMITNVIQQFYSPLADFFCFYAFISFSRSPCSIA